MGRYLGFKFHLVNWSYVCTPKNSVGLGVYRKFNRKGWDGFGHHVHYEVGDGSKVLF